MSTAFTRRHLLKGFGLGIGAAAFMPATLGRAAGWPEQPVTAVVGFSPGGGIDGTTRTITGQMAPILNATINTVNRPGAAAHVATDYVLRQPADGYSWLFSATYNKGHRAQKISDRVPYKDWQFYGIDTSIMSWSVPVDSPIKDFAELVDRAKKSPGSISISNSGVGDVWHLGSVLMQQSAGVEVKDLPYKGGAPATLAALQKEVQVVGSGIHEHVEHIKSGRMRNLAVFTDEPLEVAGVGTFKPVTEFVPAMKSSAPYGGGATMALRRETDPAILKSVGEALTKGAAEPAFKENMAKRVRFIRVVSGAEADKAAAHGEVVTANLLAKIGMAEVSPEDLNLPTIEAFDEWWKKNAPEPTY